MDVGIQFSVRRDRSESVMVAGIVRHHWLEKTCSVWPSDKESRITQPENGRGVQNMYKK